MNYGLLEALQTAEEYLLGQAKVPFIEYNPSGDWEDYLPQYEYQADNFETNGCTVWGTQNQIETFHKFLYGSEPNYSENYTYLLTPINPDRGANPHNVYECIRREGLVENSLMRTPKSKGEFLDTTRLTSSLRAKGQEWLKTNDLRHEWLWSKRPENALELMKEALKTSPLGVSVTAWYEDENGTYVDMGQPNGHWCMVYRIDDKGIWVFDSYNATKKRLSLDHKISRAKRIWLNNKTRRGSWRHVGVLQDILKSLKLMKPTLLDVCKANLGKDVTPQDKVSDEVACAEVVTTLIKMVYPEMPIITGTWTLHHYMQDPTNDFIELDAPEPGAIIISPTGSGLRGTIGHVGIIDDKGLIMSNNSFGTFKGQFTQNFSLGTWIRRYKDQQGMIVRFFKHV